MGILQNIKKMFSSNQQEKELDIVLDTSFVFPYSSDKETKRQQIWDNLQKGLLLEDTQVFIPWLTPYSQLNKYAEQRRDSGDRTNWFLGEHKILDGISSFVAVMKWIIVKDSEPFSKIDEFLGVDDSGNQKFIMLKEKLMDLLGEPAYMELEKFGIYDLGTIQWTKDNATISLVGIEQFECKYRLYVGLTGK